MLAVRCKACNREVVSSNKPKSCGCSNMTTVSGDNVTAKDLSKVIMLNSGKVVEKSALSPQDMQWQEERRKRKVKKLDFEVR